MIRRCCGSSTRSWRRFSGTVVTYAQIARQTRLQRLGMGALTTSQFAPASTPEQSNEPVPGTGDTHDGGGGDCKQPPEASEYSVPTGQTPASSGAAATHPYAGVRQISDSEQSAAPHPNVPASIEAASPSAAWSLPASVLPSPSWPSGQSLLSVPSSPHPSTDAAPGYLVSSSDGPVLATLPARGSGSPCGPCSSA